jgi:hypothetical protein
MGEIDGVRVGNFHTAGDTTAFPDGSERTVARIGPTWVGRGIYLPGWRWSLHAQPAHGRPSEAHAGFVLSGQMLLQAVDGAQVIVGPGEAFYAPPDHDAWVQGDEPCVALDFPLESSGR